MCPPPYAGRNTLKVKIGDEVEVSGYSVPARVIGVMDNIVAVAVGSVRTKVDRSQVVQVFTASSESPRRDHHSNEIVMSFDVDIHGMRADEAREAIERGVDTAILSGAHQVRLIHGKGTGVLRTVVAEVLTEHTEVHTFEMATAHEGGEGVTVATLEAWIR